MAVPRVEYIDGEKIFHLSNEDNEVYKKLMNEKKFDEAKRFRLACYDRYEAEEAEEEN